MSEPTLSEIGSKIDAVAKDVGTLKLDVSTLKQDVGDIKESLITTDATVTALYQEMVGSRPNHSDRITKLETNVHKIIELTPGADAALHQPTYDF